MIRIGLTGLGFMGSVHTNAWSQIEGAQVTAVCDARLPQGTRGEIGSAFATQLAKPGASPTLDDGVVFFNDFTEFLSSAPIDAVDICTPTDLHARQTLAALDSGFPVFCEKPMGLSDDETASMIAASGKNGKPLGIGQCLRFWPEYVEMKRLIDEKPYGEVIFARFERFSAPPRWSTDNWMMAPLRSGGSILDLHIHDVDMVHHLFGMPDRIRAYGREASHGIAHVHTLYRYGDLTIESTGGWSVASSYGFRMLALIGFEGATVEYGSSSKTSLCIYPEDGEPIYPSLDSRNGYYHELADFARTIETGTSSGTVTPESAALSVSLCRLEERSVREARELDTAGLRR